MWWFVHWQSQVNTLDTDTVVVLATDKFRVNDMIIAMKSGHTECKAASCQPMAYSAHTGDRVWDPLPSDFRGDVTFTATNLLRRTSSCTVGITTFTTQTSWDGGSMDVTGGSKAYIGGEFRHPIYYIGSTYPVAGPKLQLNVTNADIFENYYGSAGEITFEVTVTPHVDGLVQFSVTSGAMMIAPENFHGPSNNNRSTRYTAKLVGKDVKGAVAVVHRWSFAVQKRPTFKVLDFARVDTRRDEFTSGSEVVASMSERVRTPFAAGEAFRVSTVNLTKVAGADPARCTFTLRGNASFGGLFINPATGAILGLIDKVGSYRMILVALNEYGAEDVLEDVVLNVRKTDVGVAKYGPGGKGCGDNGQAVDDTGLRFDETFACSCENGFEGNNCDVTEVDSGTIVAVALTSVIAMLCAVYFVKKYQAYTARIAPVDFAAQLQHLVDAGVLPDDLVEQINDARTPRELPRIWLTLVDRLGAGSFGEVCAQHQSRETTCPTCPLAT